MPRRIKIAKTPAEARLIWEKVREDAEKQIVALVNSGCVDAVSAILTDEQRRDLADDWNEGRAL